MVERWAFLQGLPLLPLSDTTNLTPLVSGAKLYDHVRQMTYSIVPSYILTTLLFAIVGYQYGDVEVDIESVSEISQYLTSHFNIGLMALTPIVVLMILMVLKKPAVPSIFLSALYGGLLAFFYQGYSLTHLFNIMYDGFMIDSGIEIIDELLQRGGLTEMLPLVALFLFSLGLGGLLAESGILKVIVDSFADKINNNFVLVLVTMLLSYITVGLGGAVAFSAVMTSALMKPLYKKMNLRPENLSRVIETCATLGAALIPWTGSGMFATTTLGVSVSSYIPFMFLTYITPVVVLIYAATGFTMTTYDDKK